jgi:uncharacterized protein YggE
VAESKTFVQGDAVMIRVFNRVVNSHRVVRVALFVCAASFPLFASGQSNRTKIHGFWVAGSSSVTVKADEAILFLVILGKGEDAAGALAENERITQQVEQALVGQGLKGKYRFTANEFISGGAISVGPARLLPMGMAPRLYYPRPELRSFCFEVRKYVIVTFTEKDLASEAFDQTLADAIDALTRAGARQPELPPQFSQFKFRGPVVFTVKDPAPALREAVREATDRASRMAQEVARNSGVKLGRILDARVNRPLEVPLGRQQEPEILNELHVQYWSASKDAVTIPATFAVEYSTK